MLNRRQFLAQTAAAGAAAAFARPARLFARGAAADPITVALVGVGAQGRVLLDDTLRIPGVRFAAVCDIWDYNRQYGERYLKKHGHAVRAYRDFQDMLDRERDVQAVIVATPDFWHAPHSIACLRAGKDVYCEKMMSNTIEGARSMVRAMRETGRLLQIGHQRRSNPRYLVALNHLIREAALPGRLTTVNGQWNRAVSADLGWPARAAIPPPVLQQYGYADMHQFRNWRWFKKYGGGPLSDLGAHQIDVFNWFLGGPPDTVMAGGGPDYYPRHEWFDNAMVIFKYSTPAGPVRAFYQVQTTTSAGGYYEQFMGTEGTIRMSENPKYTAIYREANARDWEPWVRRNFLRSQESAAPSGDDAGVVDARETAELATYALPVVLNQPPHQPHLENFFHAVRGQGKLNCPADEAFRSEMSIFKACAAVSAGQTIALTPDDFKNMNAHFTRLTLAASLALGASALRADELVPLKLSLPKPFLVGTPLPLERPGLEHPRPGKRPDFMVPKGTVNLALHREVTSSDPEPVVGDLSLITDGEKSGEEGNYVELGQGKQWIQIDLGRRSPLYAIALWHYHSQARIYFDVVVQVSDDPDFLQGVATLYNNDVVNRSGLGAGQDLLYIETFEGRIVDAKGMKARYVRLYSRGNSTNDMNHYIEVEVYGKPAA